MNGWEWVWLLAAALTAAALAVLVTVAGGIHHTERERRWERERRAAEQRERYVVAFRGVATALEQIGEAMLVTITAVSDAFTRLGQGVQVSAGFPPPRVDRPPMPAGIASEPPAITRGARVVLGEPVAVSVAPLGTPPDGDGWKPLGVAREGVRFLDPEPTTADETWEGLSTRFAARPRERRVEFTGHDLAALMARFEDEQRRQRIDGSFRYPGGRRGTTGGN